MQPAYSRTDNLTPFEKFRERQVQQLVQGWPAETIPEALEDLSRKEFTDMVRTSIWCDGIPNAELTPLLLVLRLLYREYTRYAYEAFVKLGSTLLTIQKRYPNDREFWGHAEANVRFGSRANALLAMEAASETNLA